MKSYKHILFLLAGILSMAACTREPQTGPSGYLTAGIERDGTVSVVATRAEVTADSPFKLDIKKGSALVTSVDDHRTLMSNPIQLTCATYNVSAQNRDITPAVFDSPRYYGENTVKVLADQVVNVDITCSLADAMVTANFAPGFTDNFKDWSLTVTNGEGSLTWSKSLANLDKEGFFSVTGTLTWTLNLTNNADRKYSLTDTYTNVKAKQLYALNFNVEAADPTTGAAGPIKIVLDDKMTEREFDMLLDFTSAEAEATGANAWALFADISGEFKSNLTPAGLRLEYKKVSEESWTPYTGSLDVNPDTKKFSARISGLEPATSYVVRAVTDKEAGKKQISFTTEAAADVYNMKFDFWWQDGKAWMPNESSAVHIWDSANPGSASFNFIPTTPESNHVAVAGPGSKAARLESLYAMVKFAAGNIYTGKFGGLVGTSGAKIDWGTPFTSRPLALKGYFDYSPKAIDRTDNAHSHLKGQTDICQIQVLLTDRTEQFHINSTTNEFVDVNGPDIIAYGCLESNVATSTKSELVNGYEPFTINLEYRDLTRKPAQIVIVAASSKYGDFFTGGVGSVLYLDEFEFVYDPDQL